MLPIRDGPLNFNGTLEEVITEGHYARLAQQTGFRIPPLTDIMPGKPLQPRVGRNRWIVDCPDCRGAEFLWPEGLFMCCSCWNARAKHKWRRVTIPANRAQIEAVLRARPMPDDRGWWPGETVADLKRENSERGLPEEVTT